MLRRIDACQRELEAADFYTLEPRIAKVAEGVCTRLSSALSAKASTLRSFLLDYSILVIHSVDNFRNQLLVSYLLFIKELYGYYDVLIK